MKKCSKCKQLKTLDNFYIHSVKGKKYPTSWCKLCIKEKDRKYYWNNREKELKKRKKWQRENPDKVKETRRKTNWKIKIETLNRYGGECACCGETELKFLAIDHIENDGAEHRKRLKMTGGAGNFYYWLKRNNYPEGFQVLCHNCNMAKAFYGKCPHQDK